MQLCCEIMLLLMDTDMPDRLIHEKIHNVLVAEDEVINYLCLEALLRKKRNVKLIHARNGKEAVELCQRTVFDLVLMDIKMPLMDGFEATRRIKEQFPNLPVIMQTAFTSQSDREYASNCGCNDFLSKPISKERLFELVDHYLAQKSAV